MLALIPNPEPGRSACCKICSLIQLRWLAEVYTIIGPKPKLIGVSMISSSTWEIALPLLIGINVLPQLHFSWMAVTLFSSYGKFGYWLEQIENSWNGHLQKRADVVTAELGIKESILFSCSHMLESHPVSVK